MSPKKILNALLRQWEDPSGVFAPPSPIPLAHAWLCQDCEKIVEGHSKEGKCYSCDSINIVPVSRYLEVVRRHVRRRIVAIAREEKPAVNPFYFLTALKESQVPAYTEECLFCIEPRAKAPEKCTKSFDEKHRWIALYQR